MNNTNFEKTAESRPVSGTTVKVVTKKACASAVLTTVTLGCFCTGGGHSLVLWWALFWFGVCGNLTPGLFFTGIQQRQCIIRRL